MRLRSRRIPIDHDLFQLELTGGASFRCGRARSDGYGYAAGDGIEGPARSTPRDSHLRRTRCRRRSRGRAQPLRCCWPRVLVRTTCGPVRRGEFTTKAMSGRSSCRRRRTACDRSGCTRPTRGPKCCVGIDQRAIGDRSVARAHRCGRDRSWEKIIGFHCGVGDSYDAQMQRQQDAPPGVLEIPNESDGED